MSSYGCLNEEKSLLPHILEKHYEQHLFQRFDGRQQATFCSLKDRRNERCHWILGIYSKKNIFVHVNCLLNLPHQGQAAQSN